MPSLPILYQHLDNSVGLGHKMRCMAIGQEWSRRGGKVHQIIGTDCRDKGVHLFDGYSFKEEDWVVANGPVVLFRDFGGAVESANLVICHMPKMEEQFPTGESYLIGPKYFPLRTAFKSIPPKADENTPIERSHIFDCDAHNRELHPNIMVARMAAARIILCSAGITAYESLYLGKVTLLRMAADNQLGTYNGLISMGYALPVKGTKLESLDFETRQILSRGRNLVDGFGSQRIVDRILEL